MTDLEKVLLLKEKLESYEPNFEYQKRLVIHNDSDHLRGGVEVRILFYLVKNGSFGIMDGIKFKSWCFENALEFSSAEYDTTTQIVDLSIVYSKNADHLI